MLTLRRSQDRGHARQGWLDSRHTFSFADYYDDRHMGFRALRVINEDRVQPGKGFGTHDHRDMEIISYVLAGTIAHKDSLGTGAELRPGEIQRMTAGTGVQHSEFNPSATEPLHFLQIWILPEAAGLKPSYEQKQFPLADRQNRFRLLASRDGREGSVTVHQDVALWGALLETGMTLEHSLAPGRHAWLQVARGKVVFNGQKLSEGDGAAISNESLLRFVGEIPAELLLFDLG
ncbi:MAG: pirin family protein [Myxococcaceae bacterium]